MDEAVRDLLKKHSRPTTLKEMLRASARSMPANDAAPKPPKRAQRKRPRAMNERPDSKPALMDWIKTVAIALLLGPAVGGVVLGVMLGVVAVFDDPSQWQIFGIIPLAVMYAYFVGLPIAVLAIVFFLIVSRFRSTGTARLAVGCGLLSAALFVIAVEASRGSGPASVQPTWRDSLMYFLLFGVPAAASSWACWRITRRFHRLA